MQCSCSGYTVDREVVRNKHVIGNYMKCIACGRIEWLWKARDFNDLMKGKRTTRSTDDSH